jgi:Flp pilus assembly protein TadG
MTGHRPEHSCGHHHGPGLVAFSRYWPSWCRPKARLERDRGSAAIEAAVLAPALLALIGVAIVGGRIQVSGGAIETAAHDAARAASISRTADQARANAYTAADATLTQAGLHCARLTVTVDTSGFAIPVGQPATVTADVECVVDFADLVPVDGLPGRKTLRATFTSVLDTFRARQ